MKDWNPNKLFTKTAMMAAILVLPTTSIAEIDETQRGLKSRVPVKPFFEEPRFKESKPAPLASEKVLPAAPAKSSGQGITDSPKFELQRIEILGSTIFSAAELAAMLAPYENRLVTIDELQALRHALSLKYFQRGYVNSGVIIPDQDIKSGVVKFQVIEGQLTKLNLSGNDGLVDSYILDRINLGVDQPLNVEDLQHALRSIQQNPLIRKINAQLKPAKELGFAELDVIVTEADTQRLTISADNYRSPSIGAEEITLAYSNGNLIGLGDTLGLSYSKTEGLSSASVNYQIPLTAEDTSLSFFYSQSDSEVIEAPFDEIEIESESSNYGVSLSSPIYKDNNTSFSLNTGMTFKDSSSFLLGEPFSFSAGAIEGQSKSSTLEIGGSFVYRASAEVYALSLTARQGLDMFDANKNSDSDIPDSSFLTFLAQGQYAARIESLPGSQFIIRTAFQMSMDPLLSIEKFSVGGHSTVRGYRENQLVRDNGLTASAEFRYPLFADESGNDPYNFQLAPFLDWGTAWDEDVPSQDDETLDIYSAGIGFLWQPINGLNIETYWAEALESDVKQDDGDDLQDDGLHFSLSYGYRF